MMKSSITVSSSSSQHRMNNALGESGSCAESPNDVHLRCRWQGQILVLDGELQQALAQFPETGQTSCFNSGLVPHGRCCMAPIGPLETKRCQPIGPHRGISTAMQGDITHLGSVHRPSQNVPSFTPVEHPMSSQNAAAAHIRMCVPHLEKGQCAPTPLKQHSAGSVVGHPVVTAVVEPAGEGGDRATATGGAVDVVPPHGWNGAPHVCGFKRLLACVPPLIRPSRGSIYQRQHVCKL